MEQSFSRNRRRLHERTKMDLKQLKNYIDKFTGQLKNGDKKCLQEQLKTLISVFPFNEYEYILMYLRDKGIISFKEYHNLRIEYVSSNRYLNLYGLAPRVFGQIWGEEHLRSISSRFMKASKKLDPKYNGQYDVWIESVKLEVKACRAINTKKRGDLVSKALRYDSNEPFWMNFQQLKPDYCDVFIFIGVFVDQIIYWVMSAEEANQNKYISHQHRGGIEYQIGITDKNISEFDKYKVTHSEIVNAVLKKSKHIKK